MAKNLRETATVAVKFLEDVLLVFKDPRVRASLDAALLASANAAAARSAAGKTQRFINDPVVIAAVEAALVITGKAVAAPPSPVTPK